MLRRSVATDPCNVFEVATKSMDRSDSGMDVPVERTTKSTATKLENAIATYLLLRAICIQIREPPNSKLTDDEERDKDDHIGRFG